MKRIFRFIIKIIVKVIIGLAFRAKVIGLENVPDKGGILLCSNHVKELDMFFIGYKLNRYVRYMSKEELFRVPVVSQFITFMGAFPVKRGKGDVNAINKAINLLNNGDIVGMFPEGTRTKYKDRAKIKARPGAPMIALKAGVPILPVAVNGDYRLLGRVTVVFGKPFKLENTKEGVYSKEDYIEMSKSIMNKIYGMLEE